jgi:CRP/FNR family transcriptional regulator, nitrogen fixation regulation protein
MSASLALSVDQGFAAAHAAFAQLRAETPAFTPGNAGAAVRHYTADSEIYAEGDDANFFYKVASGVVRTCKFLSDGRRQIDAFHVAGDVFGFETSSEHRLSAEAVSDCTLIPYRRRGFESLASRDDRVAGQLFSYAMRCLERAQDHSLLLGRRSAPQKLAAFLLEMAERRTDEGVIELAMTRQDIADYLGLTIETVSRTLSQFEREGVIELPTARRVRLRDLEALRSLNA